MAYVDHLNALREEQNIRVLLKGAVDRLAGRID